MKRVLPPFIGVVPHWVDRVRPDVEEGEVVDEIEFEVEFEIEVEIEVRVRKVGKVEIKTEIEEGEVEIKTEIEEEVGELEKMYEVIDNLTKECHERKWSTRADAGEILVGDTPPTSQDSINSTEFDISNIGGDEIFDFIFKYITPKGGRELAEKLLRNDPRMLLDHLESAVMEAEKK
jgi:hypothetical protein